MKRIAKTAVAPRASVPHEKVGWLAIVDPAAMRGIARGGWHELPLAGGTDRPSTGDRIDVLVTHGPRSVQEARFAGSAVVVRDQGETLRIRHRFVAPEGHLPTLAAIGRLRIATGWTHERLAGLVGGVFVLDDSDHERIEGALRAAALEFGPAPSRPAHSLPRTPGRRALISGRMAWRKPAGAASRATRVSPARRP